MRIITFYTLSTFGTAKKGLALILNDGLKKPKGTTQKKKERTLGGL